MNWEQIWQLVPIKFRRRIALVFFVLVMAFVLAYLFGYSEGISAYQCLCPII